MGRRLLHSAVILWLVQTVCAHGYGAVSGGSTGQGPRPNGHNPQNGGGVGRMLMPSKGVGHTMGPQNGYGGYPSKGTGYGPTAGVSGPNGAKANGYGAAAGVAHGRSMKGYGGQAGQGHGHQMKGNGYGAQAGGFGGKATKGLGYGGAGVLGGNGANGHSAAATKGQGAAAGQPSGNGARANGQGGVGGKPMKGYGRPSYGAVSGPGVGVGPSRGLGVPQLTRNQGRAYNNNGYNGYGAQPMGGYNGGYGHAGSSLGPRYGNGGMKGPKHGSSGVAGVPNGHGVKTNGYAGARASVGHGAIPNGHGYPHGGATKPANTGYGSFPNGYGNKPKGYGASRGGAVRPQPGFGNGAVHSGYGGKPSGHGVRNGAVLGGYGGNRGGSKPQTTKGVGALLPSQGAKIPGTGYGGPAGGPTGQLAKAANAGYGMMPNGKSTMGAGATNGKGLKGGVFSPAQPSAAPQEAVILQQAMIQGALSGLPVAPEMTQEKNQKLPFALPQGKSYKQTPLNLQGIPEPAPAFSHGTDPLAALESIPEPGLMGPQGKGLKLSTPVSAPVVPQSNPEPEPASNQGYVTGSAVPEQIGPETDVVFGVDSTAEAGVSTENIKADPETVSANIAARLIPEETLTVAVPEPKETDIQSQPEAAPPHSLGVNGLHAEQTGATENREASLSKGQGAKSAKPDCGPSGIPNGQWMKLPGPDYNAGAGGSTGMQTKGYGASAGGFSNGGGAKANKPGYGTGGYAVPGLSHGYGAGLRYAYAGNPKQPGYGQGAFLGAGYGNPYGGNADVGEASKSGFGNGYIAGVQPDYASLGQGVPAADAQSGVAAQVPYNGAPIVPAGLDGASQFELQSAGLVPNGKLGGMYGGMGGVPFGGQTLGMGAEKSSKKYGIGGLQFGAQPLTPGTPGAGKYGYGAGAYGPTGYNGFPSNGQLLGHGSTGHIPGYGQMLYEAQQAGRSPEAKSAGKYGLAGSPYQPETLGLGQTGQLAGDYENQGLHHSQPLESAPEATAGVEYDAAGLPYESLPSELHSPGKSYVKKQLLTPAAARESEGLSVDRYDNVDYINGHVQPQVVAYPAATTPSPTLVSAPSLTDDAVPRVGVEDLPGNTGPVNLSLDSAPATETQGVVQVAEEPDDLLQEQLPRQIHIQQQLKLHFHPQGAKNSKHDLSSFFGNSGFQG
uniref:calymmin isoform X4 n=1 Tax=Solea senegalensis TaxID=28829 RepID=UPI001CD842FE|nr:calymmin isoform X4 [Solea senegalensis]